MDFKTRDVMKTAQLVKPNSRKKTQKAAGAPTASKDQTKELFLDVKASSIKRCTISPATTILQTIKAIDLGGIQIAFVVNQKNELLGTVTDGDIRRGILKGISLEAEVQKVMNGRPVMVQEGEPISQILSTMKKKMLRQLPVVNLQNRFVGVKILSEYSKNGIKDNWVVLMIGGQGDRLRPLTENCPKPLLKVGNKPLLETILTSFIEHKFHRFYMAGHYKLDMVKEYFGDGSKWNAEIRYIHEDKRMGTAGALSLLPELPTEPFFVMNGDLLTKVNFQQLLDFHNEHQVQATMCVTEYDLTIPYGVVRIKDGQIDGIDEKPVQRFFVNAGIYVLEPNVLKQIPKGQSFDMPQLFERLNQSKSKTAVFPIREYWLDIGRVDDFERANGEFHEVFA